MPNVCVFGVDGWLDAIVLSSPSSCFAQGLAPMSGCMAFLEVFVEDPVHGSRTTSALIPVHSNLDAASTCKC